MSKLPEAAWNSIRDLCSPHSFLGGYLLSASTWFDILMDTGQATTAGQ